MYGEALSLIIFTIENAVPKAIPTSMPRLSVATSVVIKTAKSDRFTLHASLKDSMLINFETDTIIIEAKPEYGTN